MSQLKRELGIVDPDRGKEGERREKKQSKESISRHYKSFGTVNTSLADKLRTVGVVEERLRREIDELKVRVGELESAAHSCWGCRLRGFLDRWRSK